ncbi:MAG TPA: GNAT family N-acetyltransferase [Acidimicrobiales bacterium]|nr:GNAT family N-acetyltransferase [Acidimicrobiales bacterium]
MHVTVRPATPADVPVLRDVYRRASLSNDGDRALFSEHPELLEWSGPAVAEGRVRVAVSDGRLAGFATVAFTGTGAEVEDLFVAPEWGRRGVGRALVEAIVAIARSAGWRCLEVDANPHAVDFYTRVGFTAVGEATVPYGTGVRMRRST